MKRFDSGLFGFGADPAGHKQQQGGGRANP